MVSSSPRVAVPARGQWPSAKQDADKGTSCDKRRSGLTSVGVLTVKLIQESRALAMQSSSRQ